MFALMLAFVTCLFIFRHVLRSGFGPGMMMAKTVLLSKVPVPTSMHHARPITITQLPLSTSWEVHLQGDGTNMERLLPL